EQGLVAESAGPGTPSREFQLCAQPVAAAKHVVTMTVRFDVVAGERQGGQGFHVRYGERRADVKVVICLEAASGDLVPRPRGQLGQRLVGLTAQGNAASSLTDDRGRRGRWVGTDQDFHGLRTELPRPLDGNAQLRWRAAPEKVRGRGG